MSCLSGRSYTRSFLTPMGFDVAVGEGSCLWMCAYLPWVSVQLVAEYVCSMIMC